MIIYLSKYLLSVFANDGWSQKSISKRNLVIYLLRLRAERICYFSKNN